MKATTFAVVVSALLVVGCDPEEQEASPSTASTNQTAESEGGNPLTAPADYLGAVGQAKKRMENKVDLVSVNQAIRLFQANEGRYPQTLDEVVSKGYIARLPPPPSGMKYSYNPANGQVGMVPQ